MADYFLKNPQQKTIILGDFNIAPDPEDVWSHKQLLKVVSHTLIEVEKLKNLQKSLDFVDTHRFLAGKGVLGSVIKLKPLKRLKSNLAFFNT